MRTRIAAIALATAALGLGVAPDAGADVATTAASTGRIVCGGVRSLDIGFCVDNPLP